MPQSNSIIDSRSIGVMRQHALTHVRLVHFVVVSVVSAGHAEELRRRLLRLLNLNLTTIIRTTSGLISRFCRRGRWLA